MRDLKFRAWQKFHKEFNYYGVGCNVEEDYVWDSYLHEEIEQFTGLQDKNGVDIYEGDIIRIVTGYEYEVKPEYYSMGDRSKVLGFRVDTDGEIIGNIHTSNEVNNAQRMGQHRQDTTRR